MHRTVAYQTYRPEPSLIGPIGLTATLLYMLELTGTTGTVDAPKVRSTSDQGTVVEYRVAWEPKAG